MKADTPESADALCEEYITLADGMTVAGADPAVLNAALDAADAESDVAEAARRVRRCQAALADAEEYLAAALDMPTSDPCRGCHAAKAAAVAEAQDMVARTSAELAFAFDLLDEALAAAAVAAARLRAALGRFHGGVQEATDNARTVAEREFHGA